MPRPSAGTPGSEDACRLVPGVSGTPGSDSGGLPASPGLGSGLLCRSAGGRGRQQPHQSRDQQPPTQPLASRARPPPSHPCHHSGCRGTEVAGEGQTSASAHASSRAPGPGSEGSPPDCGSLRHHRAVVGPGVLGPGVLDPGWICRAPVPHSRRPRGPGLWPIPGRFVARRGPGGVRMNRCGRGPCGTLQPFSRKLWVSGRLPRKGMLRPAVRCLWGVSPGWASWASGHWGPRMQIPCRPGLLAGEGARVGGAFPPVHPGCRLPAAWFGDLLQTPPAPPLNRAGAQQPRGRSTTSAHGRQHAAAGAELRLLEMSGRPCVCLEQEAGFLGRQLL